METIMSIYELVVIFIASFVLTYLTIYLSIAVMLFLLQAPVALMITAGVTAWYLECKYRSVYLGWANQAKQWFKGMYTKVRHPNVVRESVAV